MPQLDPSLFATQLFWLFVTFLALFLIAWKVALPRITEVLDARQTRIDGDLEKARALKDEAEEVIATYEKTLADASLQAQDIHRQVVQTLADERTKRQIAARLTALRSEAFVLGLRTANAQFERSLSENFPYLSPGLFMLVGPRIDAQWPELVERQFLPEAHQPSEPEGPDGEAPVAPAGYSPGDNG